MEHQHLDMSLDVYIEQWHLEHDNFLWIILYLKILVVKTQKWGIKFILVKEKLDPNILPSFSMYNWAQYGWVTKVTQSELVFSWKHLI